MKKLLSLALCLLLLAVPAFAVGANVTYSGNAGRFIFAPGSEYSLTDLFPDFKDVMPGDTLTQQITVRNDADNQVKVKIYLRSHGASEERYLTFLDQLHLTVQKAQDTPMFDASAAVSGDLTEWTYLGTLYSGGTVDLNVTLEVPVELENRFQDNYGEIVWEFAVEELPISEDDPKPPQTGDASKLSLWIVLLVLSTAGSLFLLGRSRRGKKGKKVAR